MRTPLLLAALLLTAACGGTAAAPDRDGVRTDTAYEGPMQVSQRFDTADVRERAGAAGRALECLTEPAAGGGGNYDTGPETLQDDAGAALTDFLEEEGWLVSLPTEGYTVERDDGDRVLRSLDTDGRTVVAVIVHDAVEGLEGERGWGVESWAACDPAELPAELDDELGVGVWEDQDRRRVPTSEVVSYAGPEHCDWQSVTFLQLGGERGTTFLRDPDGVLVDVVPEPLQTDVAVPRGARDTGWQRDARRLWLERGGAAYLVAVDDPGDVERWPRAEDPPGCA